MPFLAPRDSPEDGPNAFFMLERNNLAGKSRTEEFSAQHVC